MCKTGTLPLLNIFPKAVASKTNGLVVVWQLIMCPTGELTARRSDWLGFTYTLLTEQRGWDYFRAVWTNNHSLSFPNTHFELDVLFQPSEVIIMESEFPHQTTNMLLILDSLEDQSGFFPAWNCWPHNVNPWRLACCSDYFIVHFGFVLLLLKKWEGKIAQVVWLEIRWFSWDWELSLTPAACLDWSYSYFA